MREILKRLARGAALAAVLPSLLSFQIRAAIMGRDRALEGSTQLLALVPGVLGQYLRRAFLSQTLDYCAPTATVEFGTLFSRCGARLEDSVYVGPRCHLGLVHIERDVLLAAGVHVPSGRHTHGVDDLSVPIREQGQSRTVVTIGENAWIGSAAVVMANVGRHAIVGAGAVVVQALPDYAIAVGVPARVVKSRLEGAHPPRTSAPAGPGGHQPPATPVTSRG